MGILKRKRIIEVGERNWKRWSDEMRCYDDYDDVSLSCKSIADRDLSKRYVELIERRIGACGAHSIQLRIEIDTHTLTLTLTQQWLSWVDQSGLSLECIGFRREPDDHRLFPVIIELLLTDLCLCLCFCFCFCLCVCLCLCLCVSDISDRQGFCFLFLFPSFVVFCIFLFLFFLFYRSLYIYNIFLNKT